MSHGGFLRQHSDDPELSSHIMHDYTQADLDEAMPAFENAVMQAIID
jgi:hypothetical protein